MPPRKPKPETEEETQETTADESAQAEQVEPIPHFIDHHAVTLTSSTTVHYGVVDKTFSKSVTVSPESIYDQQREYDKLEQQLDYHHRKFAENMPAWLRRLVNEYRNRRSGNK